MARKTKFNEEDAVREKFRLIDLSKEWRDPYERVWRRSIDFLKGKMLESDSEEDRICVNMVWPHTRVVIPAVYSRNPSITVTPKRLNGYFDTLAYKRAEILQSVLRHYIKEIDLKSEMKLVLLDGVLTGHGWSKSGYESTEELEVKAESKTLVRKLLDSMKDVLLGEEEEEYEAKKGPYFHEQVTKEKAWNIRTSPFDIFVPAFSRRDKELLWIAERFILPKEYAERHWGKELKASTNAKELLATLRGDPAGGKRLAEVSDMEYIIAYEFWDGEKGNTCWLAENNDFYLDEYPTEYDYLDSNYHPYLMLRMGEVTDEFYPMGDIEPAIPQIKEVNEIRTQMNTHRKRYARKYFAKEGALDEESKEALRSGEDGAIAEVKDLDDGEPVQNAILPVVDANVSPEMYSQEKRALEDAYNIMGTTDYRSAAAGGTETATQASIMDKQASTRIGERIDIVNEYVIRVIRNLAMIIQKYHTPEHIADIVGGEARYWKQILDKEELREEYAFNVDYGSTAPVDPQVELAKFERFYGVAKGDPLYNQVKLRLELARKYGFEEPETWLDPKAAYQLEMQREAALKAGVLTENSEEGSGQIEGAGLGETPSQGNKLITGQAEGLPGDRGGTSQRGTAPVRY